MIIFYLYFAPTIPIESNWLNLMVSHLAGHLSPLLFCLYVNSISKYIKNAQLLLNADNIKLFETNSDCLHLQEELDKFTLWASHLCISLNVKKCSIILFSRYKTPTYNPYTLNIVQLHQVHLIKDFGIHYPCTCID